MKNTLYGLNIRREAIEERISELPDRTVEITQSEQPINKIMNRASEICGTITKDITRVIRVAEGKDPKSMQRSNG